MVDELLERERQREMGSKKHRWKISFHWSPSSSSIKTQPPKEFICSISGSLMADPVIVSSGQTFERNCVHACKQLGFSPTPSAGTASSLDFSAIIPNLALKSTILKWCDAFLIEHPEPLDFQSAEKLVRTLMAATDKQKSQFELTRQPSHSSSSNSEEPVISIPTTPLTFTTRPACYSSPSSSEMEPQNPNSLEEDEIINKLRSSRLFEQEEAVISLRKVTRIREETRFDLCTVSLLSTLKSLIVSKYATIQVNSIAALVNLSLENKNKVKIVRSGIVPPLIDVLKGGSPEAQDHVAGALFSLAIDDQNKTAIGVLGALPPLLHALRSESERTRNDSALALYHLSLVQSNRAKLVRLGSVQVLLGVLKSGRIMGRVMLVLCNLAACVEARVAMLDGAAVECFVGMMRRDGFDSESTRESCMVALYGLSHGGLRFKVLAKEAGAEAVLRKVEEVGNGKMREKAKAILETMSERDDAEEEVVDWEALLNSGEVSRTQCELVYRANKSGSNLTRF